MSSVLTRYSLKEPKLRVKATRSPSPHPFFLDFLPDSLLTGFIVISLVMFLIAWPDANSMRHPERKPHKEVDFVGSFLLIAASVLVVFAFQESGAHPGFWGSALFIAPLVTGSVCWLLLGVYEVGIQKFKQDSIAPLLPKSLLTRRIYVAGALTAVITGFPYYVVVYNVPLHLQIVNDKTPLIAGISLLPLLVSTATGSMLGGAISSKKDMSFYSLTIGSCLLALGTGLLSTISGGHSIDPKLYGFEVFVGLGFGLSVSTPSILAAVQCEIKDHGQSSYHQVLAKANVSQPRRKGLSLKLESSADLLESQHLRPSWVSLKAIN